MALPNVVRVSIFEGARWCLLAEIGRREACELGAQAGGLGVLREKVQNTVNSERQRRGTLRESILRIHIVTANLVKDDLGKLANCCMCRHLQNEHFMGKQKLKPSRLETNSNSNKSEVPCQT